MSFTQAFWDAVTRLKGYNLGIYNAVSNALGLSGVGGMAANWAKHSKDLATVGEQIATAFGTLAPSVSTIGMSWDGATATADPGAGKVRATVAPPTAGSFSLIVSTTDASGQDVSALIAEMGASTSTVKARARLVKVGNPAAYVDVSVTGVSGAGAYRTVAVTYLAGPGGFAAGDAVVLGWLRTGDKGDTGAAGSANVAANTDGAAGISVVNSSSGSSASARITLGDSSDTQDAYIQVNGPGNATHGGARSLNILGNAGDICMLVGRLAPRVIARFKNIAGAYGVTFAPSDTAPTISTSGGALNLTSATGSVLVNGTPIGEDTATSIAAAATVDIGGTTAKAIKVTAGTGPITAWGTAQAGAHRDITFATSVTLTYNSVSAILVGGGNITTQAGDTCRFESLGSGNWRMLSYQRANGQALGTGTSAQALSLTDRATGIAISNNALTATDSSGALLSGRATTAMTAPVYWEVAIDAVTSAVSLGVATAAVPLNDYISNAAGGYAYGLSGSKANNGSGSAFGASYGAGDRLCFAFNPTTNKVWAGKVISGSAVWGGSGDPASDLNPMYVTSGTLYPAYTLNGTGTAVTFAFSRSQMLATPPAGFSAFA